MAAARKQQKIIEFIEKRIGAALFIGEILAFSALDFPLYAALMEIAEERAKIRFEIERLQRIRFAPSQIVSACGSILAQRANFNVFPSREAARGPERMHQFAHLLRSGERLAMIRKWKRNKTTTADPATNAGKYDAV